MIRHIVLTKFKPSISEEAIAEIYERLAALTDRLDGAHSFTGGRSESPERLERGYQHGFVIDFDGWDALQIYANHPDHKVLGKRLIDNAAGGVDGILVLDVEV